MEFGFWGKFCAIDAKIYVISFGIRLIFFFLLFFGFIFLFRIFFFISVHKSYYDDNSPRIDDFMLHSEHAYCLV